MPDPYDELLAHPLEVMWDLNTLLMPPSRLNCPATADALDNFLNGGPRRSALQGERFAIAANFASAANISIIVARLMQLGHGHHLVVRGNRRRPPHHYFVMANIRGTIYLADAMTRAVLRHPDQAAAYLLRGNFISFSFASHFDAALAGRLH